MRKKNVKSLGKGKVKADGTLALEKPKVPKPPGQSGYNLPAGTPTGTSGQ